MKSHFDAVSGPSTKKKFRYIGLRRTISVTPATLCC